MTLKAFAKVLIINDAGELLCLRRSISDVDRPGGWDFPGGTLEEGESFAAALARETAEETGLTLESPFLAYSKCERRDWGAGVWLYYVQYVKGRPNVRLSFEHEEAAWFTLDAFLEASDHPKHHEIVALLRQTGLTTPSEAPVSAITGRAVVCSPTGKLLLLRRSSTDPFHAGTWDLPGGRAERNEDPRETAIRETEEEAGVVLQNPKPVFAITKPHNGGVKTWVFFKDFIDDEESITLSSEHDDYMWAPPSELPPYTEYEVLLQMGAFITENNLLEG